MIIDFLSLRINLMTSNNLSFSCGVKTAVGSSKIKISTSRYKTFMISTVCFSDTDIS